MRKFIDSDTELSEHFTASIGVRAQSYEPVSSRSFDPGELHVAMRERAHRRRLERYASVQSSLRDTSSRAVLELVYVPFGTGFTSRPKADSSPRLAVEGPDFLAIALTPAWGHGSFVRLALTQKRVLAAFSRRYEGRTSDPAAVLEFLRFEAGRGAEAASFFRAVRDACEDVRSSALEVYDGVRRRRIETERAVARFRAAESERLLDAALGRKARRDRERFEDRLRGAS